MEESENLYISCMDTADVLENPEIADNEKTLHFRYLKVLVIVGLPNHFHMTGCNPTTLCAEELFAGFNGCLELRSGELKNGVLVLLFWVILKCHI